MSANNSNFQPSRSDKFDFPSFIKFLIQLGLKCFPAIENQSQAVLILAEKFMLPLLTMLKDDRSVQNSYLTKLITLVNSRAIVDFMSDLHLVLAPIYHRYCGNDYKQLLQFD